MLVRRPHIGEDQAIALFHRIPGLANSVATLAHLRFARLLETMPFDIEFPAMIATANAVLFHLAEVERGAAVTAAGMNQARPAFPIAEQHQIFAERAHFARSVRGVRG